LLDVGHARHRDGRVGGKVFEFNCSHHRVRLDFRCPVLALFGQGTRRRRGDAPMFIPERRRPDGSHVASPTQSSFALTNTVAVSVVSSSCCIIFPFALVSLMLAETASSSLERHCFHLLSWLDHCRAPLVAWPPPRVPLWLGLGIRPLLAAE